MTDTLPEFIPGTDFETGAPTAVTGETTFQSLNALIEAFGSILDPENRTALATLFVHFARPYAYSLITDPAEYEADYRARLASEDPSQPWNEGPARLSDFGIPEFSDVKAPTLTGTVLQCWVRDSYSDLAYVAQGETSDPKAATFNPMPLTAIDRPEPVRQEETSVQEPSRFDGLQKNLNESDAEVPFDEGSLDDLLSP
ncbi:MAG: hypothetical protein ABJL99_11425 [Aliishimia sp.]